MRDLAAWLAKTGVAGAIAFLAGLWSSSASQSDPQDFALIEKGRYLAIASDCASCHTVPGSDRPFSGGRAIETPFGNVISANITPDRETGIGAWTEEQFDAAVRRGIRPDGARLYPAMPYPAYAKMTSEDTRALRAFLNTVEPVRNVAPPTALPFPLSIRAVMHVWNALYFSAEQYRPDPNQSAEWNRGALLVQGAGHCGACHTPKTVLGADKADSFLQGAMIQGWFAPNLTNDATGGLGRWSVDDVAAYLKTGQNRFSAATGPMAEEIVLSSSKMHDDDLKAIAVYLKSLGGETSPLPAALPQSEPIMIAGAAIYRDQCAACHALDGRGVERLFPSLAESASVRSDDPATLIRVILRGARSVATAAEPTSPGMPSFGWQLSDLQVAAVATYIRNAWDGAAAPVTADRVKEARKHLGDRTD